MVKPRSVVVVGSSGSGKTTAVDAVRDARYAHAVVVPKRFITRPARANDNLTENQHMTASEFGAGVRDGRIWPHWCRDLGGDRLEQYGFERVAQDDNRLRVYSANNAFVRSDDASVRTVLESAQVVAVMADAAVRQARMAQRSPDLKTSELTIRNGDAASDILARADVLVIDTSNQTPEKTQTAFVKLIEDLLHHD